MGPPGPLSSSDSRGKYRLADPRNWQFWRFSTLFWRFRACFWLTRGKSQAASSFAKKRDLYCSFLTFAWGVSLPKKQCRFPMVSVKNVHLVLLLPNVCPRRFHLPGCRALSSVRCTFGQLTEARQPLSGNTLFMLFDAFHLFFCAWGLLSTRPTGTHFWEKHVGKETSFSAFSVEKDVFLPLFWRFWAVFWRFWAVSFLTLFSVLTILGGQGLSD